MITASLGAGGGLAQPGILIPLAGIILFAIAAGVILLRMRANLHASDEDEAGGFTLESLERLRASGRLTDAEFKRARDTILHRYDEIRAARRDADGDGPAASDLDPGATVENRVDNHVDNRPDGGPPR